MRRACHRSSVSVLSFSVLSVGLGLLVGCPLGEASGEPDAGPRALDGAGGDDRAIADPDAAHRDRATPPSDGGPLAESGSVGFFTVLSGSVSLWGLFDRPILASQLGITLMDGYVVTLAEGACLYLDRPMAGLCEPPCTGDQYCSADDVCVTLTADRWNAGPLRFHGPGGAVDIEPGGWGGYPIYRSLDAPLAAPGEEVTLEAEGGDYSAFTASVIVPAPLQSPPLCDLEPQAGQDLVVTWTPSDPGATVRWEMLTMMHAGNGAMLVCEAPDADGALVVPAVVVDQYLADRTNFDTFQLSRHRQVAAALEGGASVTLYARNQLDPCFHGP